MSGSVRLDGKVFVRELSDYKTRTLAQGAAETVICELRTPVRFRSYLSILANAVQAGGENWIRWDVKVNGAYFDPYVNHYSQWSDPANPREVAGEIELPQNALVQIVASRPLGSDPVDNFDATARLHVQTFDL